MWRAFLLAITFLPWAADAELVSEKDAEVVQLLRDLQEGLSVEDLHAVGQLWNDVEVISKKKDQHTAIHGYGRKRSKRQGGRQLSDDVSTVLDTMWLLFCGTFVFFMHAGFAMLEAGTGRVKNVQAILIKNLVAVCAGTLGWYFLGWSLAYGGDVKTAIWEEGGFEDCDEKANPMGCGDGYADNGFIGGASMFVGSGFLGKGEEADKAWAEGTIDPASYGGGQAYMWFFQWAFCTADCSIVSGGIAERAKFPAWIFYAFCMTTIIYPVVVCSTWGYGWLETFKKDSKGNPIGGYIDFAGSGVVHLTGGIAALVGAKVIGVRKGRFDPEKALDFEPHAHPLIVLGTFILWFGWCGFNSGSTLGLSDSGTALVAAHVMMNTTLSAATGGMTVFGLRYAITKKYDCAALCNGILAGLVSITAGCSNVESGSAVLIGAMGAVVVVASSVLVKKLEIDDPVDAFSVHGACGIWGTLAAALFDFGQGMEKHHGWGGFSATSWTEDGKDNYMTTADALAANVSEIVFVIAWSGGLSAILFGALQVAGFLRVDEAREDAGCDSECVSPKAYNMQSNLRSMDVDCASSKAQPMVFDASGETTQKEPQIPSIMSATTADSESAGQSKTPSEQFEKGESGAAVETQVSKDEPVQASPSLPVTENKPTTENKQLGEPHCRAENDLDKSDDQGSGIESLTNESPRETEEQPGLLSQPEVTQKPAVLELTAEEVAKRFPGHDVNQSRCSKQCSGMTWCAI